MRTPWLLLTLLFTSSVWADDFKLDPAPQIIIGVRPSLPRFQFPRLSDTEDLKSNLAELIGLQTPVKSQGLRGTCSIFSATAEIESLLKIRDQKENDFSENYLEFLVQAKMKGAPAGGSNTYLNIPAVQRFGTVLETDFPYEIYDWTDLEKLHESEKLRVQEVCGHLEGLPKTQCQYGHLDPTNDRFEQVALHLRDTLGLQNLQYQYLYDQGTIKAELNANRPLLFGFTFFYKAWNHRKMVELGLGERNMEAWAKGEVSTPDEEDIRISSANPAGHSVVVVGYDDEKKVYYFKNSWGKGGFGARSDLLGPGTTDGYGSITYDYAHTYGTFNKVTIQ